MQQACDAVASGKGTWRTKYEYRRNQCELHWVIILDYRLVWISKGAA